MSNDDYVDDDDFDPDMKKFDDPDAGMKPQRRKKPPSPHYRNNNSGGYGNPPVKNQFTRGGKGGPGRPKGVSNVESAMRKVVAKKITVNKKGKSITMLPAEIFAERTMEAILGKTNSPRMLEYSHNLLSKYAPEESSRDIVPDLSQLSDDEFYVLSCLMEKAWDVKATLPDVSPLGPQYTHKMEGEYRIRRRPDGHILVERIAQDDE